MDLGTKATSSNTDNLIEPPTLSQLSSSISDTHQGNMNVSICETYTNGHESEQTKKHEQDQKPDNVQTNEAVPSTTKKMRCGCMKMSDHGIMASSNLLLDLCQDWLHLDSNLPTSRTIIDFL